MAGGAAGAVPAAALGALLVLLALGAVDGAAICTASQYCCPVAKHCLTANGIPCNAAAIKAQRAVNGNAVCQAIAPSGGQSIAPSGGVSNTTCCPLTQVCVAVGAVCRGPPGWYYPSCLPSSFCGPTASGGVYKCLTPTDPGVIARATACDKGPAGVKGAKFNPLIGQCVTEGLTCEPAQNSVPDCARAEFCRKDPKLCCANTGITGHKGGGSNVGWWILTVAVIVVLVLVFYSVFCGKQNYDDYLLDGKGQFNTYTGYKFSAFDATSFDAHASLSGPGDGAAQSDFVFGRTSANPPTVFLLASIQDASQFESLLREEAAAIVDEAMRRLAARFGGTVVTHDASPSAYAMTFRTTEGALECALTLQLELYAAPWSDEMLTAEHGVYGTSALDAANAAIFRGPRLAVAVHQGEATKDEAGDGYTGAAFGDVGAMLEAGRGGQLLLSEEARRASTAWLAMSVAEAAQAGAGGPRLISLGGFRTPQGNPLRLLELLPAKLQARSRAFLAMGAVPALEAVEAEPGFYSAPDEAAEGTALVFVGAAQVAELFEDKPPAAAEALQLVQEWVATSAVAWGGYLCHFKETNALIAFASPEAAVRWWALTICASSERRKALQKRLPRAAKACGKLKVSIALASEGLDGEPHPAMGTKDYAGAALLRAQEMSEATDDDSVAMLRSVHERASAATDGAVLEDVELFQVSAQAGGAQTAWVQQKFGEDVIVYKQKAYEVDILDGVADM